MSCRYSLRRPKRPGRPNLVFRPRHKVVFAHDDLLHGLDSRNRRLPVRRLGYWCYKVNKEQGQDPRNAHHGGKVSVWECDAADLDSLGQRLARSLEGCSP